MTPDRMLPAPLDFVGKKQIAVLAPHPDDESLACGALLARAFAGVGAHVICLTDGSASHPASKAWPADRLAAQRQNELKEAIRHLGGSEKDLTWLGLPDSKLYQLDTVGIATAIAGQIEKLGVRHVFAPAMEDHHEDHKVTARIAQEISEKHPDLEFYSYPLWCRWDDPDFDRTTVRHSPSIMPAGDYRPRKRAAIQAHQSQMGQVVMDDPAGFCLPPALVEKFITEDEIFWRMT